jgi:hypothetical protein
MKATDESGMTDEDIDRMVQAASVALRKADPDLANDLSALEDALELRCFGKIMAAAMGTDPNLA